MVGLHLVGQPMLIINGPELVEDIMTRLAPYVTKEHVQRDLNRFLLYESIFFKKTEESDFAKRRKALSSSLFKNKLVLMMESIKRVTLEHLREYKDEDKVNIGEFFRQLQSKIIIQFAIGG